MFSHAMSGTITLIGSTRYKKTNAIVTNFSVGDVLYRLDKARNGILEKILIKRIVLNSNYGQIVAMYIDSMNSIYFDSDLCVRADAISAISSCLYGKISDIDKYLSAY
jgi:hypothetical protein